MDTAMLKAYIARAKELEAAVYTQKKLMEEHEAFLISQKPAAPPYIEDDQPQEPEYVDEISGSSLWRSLVLGLLLVVGGGYVKLVLAIAVGYFLLALCIILAFEKIRKAHKNRHRRDTYLYEYEKWEQKSKKQKEIYAHEYEFFQKRMEEWKNDKLQTMQRHEKVLIDLQGALKIHYEQNVLFPKYRNLVAVATMDEYLQSGRCDALEGSSGAYNLYEMELRQNIVIGTLNRILENMEQIRGNQYTLYEELSKANRAIDTIMMDIREMKSMEKLNLYFAEVTAKAAVSPKIIRGYIH